MVEINEEEEVTTEICGETKDNNKGKPNKEGEPKSPESTNGKLKMQQGEESSRVEMKEGSRVVRAQIEYLYIRSHIKSWRVTELLPEDIVVTPQNRMGQTTIYMKLLWSYNSSYLIILEGKRNSKDLELSGLKSTTYTPSPGQNDPNSAHILLKRIKQIPFPVSPIQALAVRSPLYSSPMAGNDKEPEA
ncbi:hypothetical protein RND71_042271 [Anisodus tanguticus]|uniref:Uncharacterized protein n=1 Tax=Anisodus tanguticus TaxID=243964 RepID=A0AAE1QPX9_9SOLA|nr:hypothetical protein RND71_042271 [Anisodus tanguticus]